MTATFLIRRNQVSGNNMYKGHLANVLSRFNTLIFVGLLICTFWVPHVFAGTMIVVPPPVDYEVTCEDEGPKYALLYAVVGKNIYFNMKSSIKRFNSLDRAKAEQLHYKALTIVSPGCQDNWKIERFHDKVIGSRKKLTNACEKFQSDLVIWAELDPGYKKKLNNSLKKSENCSLSLSLYAYEKGTWEILSRNLVLTFKPEYNTLELMSQKRISDTVLDLIEEIHFNN